MRSLKLCLRIIGTVVKSQMEYRYSFFMRYVVQIFGRAIEFLSIWIVLNRFRQIQEWSYFEIMFLYTLNLFSWGLANLFVGPMDRLEEMVQQGTFDSLLVYPLNPLLHLVARDFRPIFFGHLVLGGIVFAVCFSQLSIEWTVFKLVWFVLVIVGATLIQATIIIVTCTMSFWFVKSQALMTTAIYGVRSFIEYPLTIYDKWLQVVLTFLVPYAFVSFYPAQYFLDKAGESVFHPAFQYGTPAVGVVLFLLAYRFWGFGVNRYQSTGS